MTHNSWRDCRYLTQKLSALHATGTPVSSLKTRAGAEKSRTRRPVTIIESNRAAQDLVDNPVEPKSHLNARAEVAELVRPRGRPENVLQLDVSVRDALVVQVLDGAGRGAENERVGAEGGSAVGCDHQGGGGGGYAESDHQRWSRVCI